MSGGASRRTESSAACAGPAGAAGAGAPAVVAPGFAAPGLAALGLAAPAADALGALAGEREAAVVSGAGADASRRPEEQASAVASRQTDRRDGDMRTLLGDGRVERREHEGTEMRSGVVGDDAQREGELVAGLFGGEDGVDEATGGGVACVELGVVVGAHGVHRGLHLGGQLAALALGPLDLGTVDGHHGALTLHHPHAAGGPREDEVGI